LKRIPGQDGEPISYNMRRITELRNEQGYDIVNEKDNAVTGLNLKIGEYVLLKNDPDPKKIRERGVNKRIRAEVLTRDNYTCQMCGRTIGDDDPFKPGHSITLHTGHLEAHKRKNGEKIDQRELSPHDFITMCNVCNEGLKNEDFKKINILDRVKNLNKIEREKIYNLLKDEFG
jgi:5-methylcytosine-specific restriction endonuclease McrA